MESKSRRHPADGWDGPDLDTVRMLQNYNTRMAKQRLAELLLGPGRFREFSRRVDGMLLDLSRVHIDSEGWQALLGLPGDCGLADARDALFSGGMINWTEQRPAMHMALRNAGLATRLGLADGSRAESSMARMQKLAQALHDGALPADQDVAIRDVVHVGIGGSLLGTRLLYEAVGRTAPSAPRVHFLGSVDAFPREQLLPGLDPATTVVIVVSKSFTTADTLMHAARLREWLESSLGQRAARQRMFAVTERTGRAEADGYAPDQVLFLPAWVGGRYSLWSPVSLSAAAAMGTKAFAELLEGAAAMDRHFQEAEPADNLPVLLGLSGVWHRNICGYGSWAVIPYDQRLRSLPAHLQQVIMESNGKSVRASGRRVDYGTAPVIWGESGTEAQHSIFQALHQGSDIVPVHMIGVIRPAHEDRDAHDELLANMLAQATALATGRSAAETRRQLAAEGVDAGELLPHRAFGGNRPSELLMLDELTPAALGGLLALYEHKVFVESVVWSINAFDQWGVELGKTLAPDIRADLQTGASGGSGPTELLDYINERR